MKILAATILAFVLALPTQAQVTINGVTLPATVKAGESTLSLNGGGIRKKLFFKNTSSKKI